MKKINQTNLKRRISLMLLITIFLMSSLVVGCGKKNVNTVSTKEDALVEMCIRDRFESVSRII